MQEEDRKRIGMNRRDLFNVLPVAAVAVVVPGTTLAHDHGTATPQKPPPFQRQTFDDHQWKTVKVLTDLIIPKDERSGSATDARVPEFLDDLIAFQTADKGTDRLKAEIFGGLTWLDRESNRLFSANFADASADQQRQILDRIAWPDRIAADDKHAAAFFRVFRNLTVSGFFSSKMGVEDLPYLGNTVVTDWKGCDPKVWRIIEQRLQAQDSNPTAPARKSPTTEPETSDTD